MANGLIIVAASSAVLLGLFGISCYLMSIVNPPPLLVEEDLGPETKARIDPPAGGDNGGDKSDDKKDDKSDDKKDDKSDDKDDDKGGRKGGGDDTSGRRRHEVDVASKTSGTTPKLKVNVNSSSKGRRSVRLPRKFHESKSVILEVSGDEGSPRIEIVFYPNHLMTEKKTRQTRKDVPYVEVYDKSRESVLVKISPDGKVRFEEHGIVIPANVAEDMTSEQTIATDLDTLKPMSTEEQTYGTNTLMPIFKENKSVDLNATEPINNSVVDYIYTHTAITESKAHDEVSISEDNTAVDTYTQSPGITEITEIMTDKSEIDYVYNNTTLVVNTLYDEISTIIENAATDEDTQAPIFKESMVDDLDTKISTEIDDVLASERSSLDNLTTGSISEITVSDNLDPEVPISRENSAEDSVTIASTFEKRAGDDLDIKTPSPSEEMVVSDTNEAIFADTTSNDLNNHAIYRENGAEDATTVVSTFDKQFVGDFDTKTPPSEEVVVSVTNEPIFAETTPNDFNNNAISRENDVEDVAMVASTFGKRDGDDFDIKSSPPEEMIVSNTNAAILEDTTPSDSNDDSISKENDAGDAITSTTTNVADQSGETQQELPSTVETVESTDAVTDDSVTETTETSYSQPVEGISDEVSEATDYYVISDTANKVTVDSIEAAAESNQEGIFKD